jgi:hypothetical protein
MLDHVGKRDQIKPSLAARRRQLIRRKHFNPCLTHELERSRIKVYAEDGVAKALHAQQKLPPPTAEIKNLSRLGRSKAVIEVSLANSAPRKTVDCVPGEINEPLRSAIPSPDISPFQPTREAAA